MSRALRGQLHANGPRRVVVSTMARRSGARRVLAMSWHVSTRLSQWRLDLADVAFLRTATP